MKALPLSSRGNHSSRGSSLLYTAMTGTMHCPSKSLVLYLSKSHTSNFSLSVVGSSEVLSEIKYIRDMLRIVG